MGYCTHMSRRVNQRWPDGLFERVEAAAAAMDGCSVTDLTVLALERTIAEMPGALPVSAPSKREAKPEPPVQARTRIPDRPPAERAAKAQGPTCPRCGGLATYVKGKARCMAGCKR